MKLKPQSLYEIFVEEELRRLDEVRQTIIENSLRHLTNAIQIGLHQDLIIDPPYGANEYTLYYTPDTGLTTHDGINVNFPNGFVIARGGSSVRDFLAPDGSYQDAQMGFRTLLTPRSHR